MLLDRERRSDEAEFILPRVRQGGLGTVRTVINLRKPTRYHVDLLNDLRVKPGTTLQELSREWGRALSVETVTKRFYEEFRELRDALVTALLKCNQDNPELVDKDPEKDEEFDRHLKAFGTRLLSRLLFLWFLQQKRWLGTERPGEGPQTFLVDLVARQEEKAPEGNGYFNDVLVPLFFDGLGLSLDHILHRRVAERFGQVPYLGGGLFREGADDFEARLFGLSEATGLRQRPVVLPDDIFDPAKDRPAESGRRRGKSERTVFGLLRGYRFTTQESTPDDQSVDPDPEMLGKVFENLYQEDDRHATGAYYTPREIVRYMCRQALDGYLRDETGVDQETIDRIRAAAVEWLPTDQRLDTVLASRMTAALDRVKVLDPAVGSGAFLVGFVQEVVLLKRGIEQADTGAVFEPASYDVAEWKRRITADNLYGVDSNAAAVEICHLRLWLSMIVDLEVDSFRQIPALPDLDFRIVAGDSLVDRLGEERFEYSLPLLSARKAALTAEYALVGETRDKLARLRERFAGERPIGQDPIEVRRLKQQIQQTATDLVRYEVSAALAKARADLELSRGPVASKRVNTAVKRVERLERLRDSLRPDMEYQKPFLWPANFPDVVTPGGGFDVVLANPPYVRQEKLDATDQDTYKHAFPDVHAGTADLLVYFFGRAVQVLRDGGQLAFITSNKYMRAAYGEKLRSYLPSALQVAGSD